MAPTNISEFEEDFRRYDLEAFAVISENFPNISGNIKFPENLQPPIPDSEHLNTRTW